MNTQRWLKQREPTWQKLESLLKVIAEKRIDALSQNDLRDLGRLYRTASADLSRARAANLGSETQLYLNNLVVTAHNQVYQRKQNRLKDLFDFLWYTFPALVRQNILYVLAALTVVNSAGAISYFSVLHDAHFAQLEVSPGQPLVPEDMWQIIESRHLWTDKAAKYSPIAMSAIATNNIRVAILAFVFGITFGFGTFVILVFNGISIGTVLGLCRSYQLDDRLFAFMAGHGVLELSAIFISGGAGFLMGKALLFPGRLTRLESLRSVSRDAVSIFGGCIPLLLIAGSIEGFISPRTDLEPNTKYIISIATLIALVLYLFVPRVKREEGSQQKNNASSPLQ
jgi:uncharacterized membrane protein SpoIIM required for sporulation